MTKDPNELRSFMLSTIGMMETAKRRLWHAEDRLAQLTTTRHELNEQITEAELALKRAQQDYDEHRQLLDENWSFVRSEYERGVEATATEVASR